MAGNKRAWIAAGIALAAGVGLVTAIAARPRRPAKGSRALLLGDSLAVGLAPHLKAHAEDDGVEFDALAKGGTVIHQWLTSAKLEAVLAGFKPDLVMVSLGTNDSFSKVRDPAANARALVKKLEAAGAEVLWIGAPTLPAKYGQYAHDPAIIAAIEAEAPFYFHSETLELPRGDGLHPTPAGYGAWAGAIWQWLS